MLLPFPRIDPYIEAPAIWSDFHGDATAAMLAELNLYPSTMLHDNSSSGEQDSDMAVVTAAPCFLHLQRCQTRQPCDWMSTCGHRKYVKNGLLPVYTCLLTHGSKSYHM